MPPAKKTPASEQLALAAQPPPALVEYQFGAEAWRCARFDELVAEFETVTPELLERFHQAASLNGRRWTFVRRLFGFRPNLPSPDTDPEDTRVWTRDELCEKFQLTRPQLKQELDAVRGAWVAFLKTSAPAAVKPEAPPVKPTMELNLGDDPILKQYHFEVFFSGDNASVERAWFIEKVKEFEMVLKEKIVGGLAHSACLTALRLRRISKRLDTYEEKDHGKKEWKGDYDLSKSIAEDYKKLVKEIIDLCPAASSLAGKMAIQPVCSSITQAILEAKANNDTRLVDGFYTATEMQIQCRMSVQMPEPKYRAGWVMVMFAAKEGTFDPNWKSPFPEWQVGAIDHAWKAAYVAAHRKAGQPLPDLAADGPASEYPDLYVPENKTAGSLESKA